MCRENGRLSPVRSCLFERSRLSGNVPGTIRTYVVPCGGGADNERAGTGDDTAYGPPFPLGLAGDADQTIAAFAARLQDAVDLNAVREDLASVVHKTLEPAHVSVWMRQAGKEVASASSTANRRDSGTCPVAGPLPR